METAKFSADLADFESSARRNFQPTRTRCPVRGRESANSLLSPNPATLCQSVDFSTRELILVDSTREDAISLSNQPELSFTAMAKRNGDEQNGESVQPPIPLAQYTGLPDFEYVERLGSFPDKKVIRILCRHKKDGRNAILLLNKVAYSEEQVDLQKLLSGIKLEHVSDNDVYGSYSAGFDGSGFDIHKATLIYPANDVHIKKYREAPVHLLFETPEQYQQISKEFMDGKALNMDWVYNILEGRKEQDKIMFKDDDPEKGFYLMVDVKWDGTTIEEMYYQAIVLKRGIKSLRELDATHLPLLENIYTKSVETIQAKHNIPPSQLAFYVHYHPSYYHLHIHVRHIRQESDLTFIPLQSVISTLKICPNFYKLTTLPFKTKEGHPLYELFRGANALSFDVKSLNISNGKQEVSSGAVGDSAANGTQPVA